MKIDPQTGVMEFSSKIVLRPGMTRSQLLTIDVEWEEWDVVDNVPFSFRTIFKLPNKGLSPKIILVVFVGIENNPLDFWTLGPWDAPEGTQARPDGKYTKWMRRWFQDMCTVGLPLKREWGHVDASFDPWNQSASIVCNYRERFNSDEEWDKYKKDNNY